MPVDPTFATSGPEWQIAAPQAEPGAGAEDGGGFGGALSNAIDRLDSLQQHAAVASQQLATGQAADAESVVMAVERARLAMQLASQLRTKSVEAAQDLLHTQV
jgi:flagellar hook-basal body complex protein FliE